MMIIKASFCALVSFTISFCLAQDFLDDTLEQLEILDATGPPGWNEDWALEFGYTKPGQTPTASKCYSSKATNVEVFVRIETGDVSTVNLLNRQDLGSRMKTLQVFVCENGEKCALCANAPDTPTSSWAKLHCETGLLRGNQIKLKNPSSHVDFCEIYVIGKKLDVKKPSILRGVGTDAWSADWVLTNGYSKAGEQQTPDTCYCSSFPLDAYVLLDITPASVSKVRLLNRKEKTLENRLKKTIVEVCSKGGLCKVCGEAPDTDYGEWATITCTDGPLKGNVLKMTQKNIYLQFCEVDIIGETLGPCSDNCQDFHRFCGALKSKSFVQDYKTMLEAGTLEAFGNSTSFPPNPSCDDDFYKMGCPKTCLECTTC